MDDHHKTLCRVQFLLEWGATCGLPRENLFPGLDPQHTVSSRDAQLVAGSSFHLQPAPLNSISCNLQPVQIKGQPPCPLAGHSYSITFMIDVYVWFKEWSLPLAPRIL